jgi:phosphopantothenoylcysteine decarboxylase/phosphopantothenate--cysteine ligase
MTRTTRTSARTPTEPFVVLAVSGSIAAYKAVEVARLLVKAGVAVQPIMTAAAERFVGSATLAGICGRVVHRDMFDAHAAGELHVELAAHADAIAVVPATAELLADLAQGRAGDLVRATLLCAECPVVAAPAMHPRMWSHPATARNVRQLAADGRVELVGPVAGEVASGDQGLGRMAEPAEIAAAVLARIAARHDLAGLRIVVSAGPTVEDLDPARFLSNRSSGKMGFAVAARAAARGASVTLVSGPVSLATPRGVARVDVRSALDMRAALHDHLAGADALVMAAAVADYRVASPSQAKIKRSDAALTLTLEPNPDLLAEIGHARTGERPYLVGFALETASGDELVAHARAKLDKKKVDLVVANRAEEAFDGDDNRILLVTADEVRSLERAPKLVLADAILDRVAARFALVERS